MKKETGKLLASAIALLLPSFGQGEDTKILLILDGCHSAKRGYRPNSTTGRENQQPTHSENNLEY